MLPQSPHAYAAQQPTVESSAQAVRPTQRNSGGTAGHLLQRTKLVLRGLMGRAEPASKPPAAKISRQSIDDTVLNQLHHVIGHQQIKQFEELWSRLQSGQQDVQARRSLAALYATVMHANRVKVHDNDSFSLCTSIGERALELDENCAAAIEQLAIAYGIVQAPLREAERLCDLTADLRHLTGLRAKDIDLPALPTVWPWSVSSDFLYAYWRTFRGDPIRDEQARRALDMYWQAPEASRAFDVEVRNLRLLSARLQRFY